MSKDECLELFIPEIGSMQLSKNLISSSIENIHIHGDCKIFISLENIQDLLIECRESLIEDRKFSTILKINELII